MKKITADTMLPLSFIVVLAGAILWLSTIRAELSYATSQIIKLESYQKNIGDRLSRIEGKIDVLIGRKD